MTWEAVTAIASLSSAIVVCVAAVAAVIQIRHLRTGNQLEAFLRIYDVFNSPDMIAARRYCLEELPDVLANDSLRAAFIAGPIEPRLLLVGNFENEVGALVVDGFLEERLVWPLVPIAARLWAIAEPVAQHLRSQRDYPVWADFEYIAALRERISIDRYVNRFPTWFRDRLRTRRTLSNDG